MAGLGLLAGAALGNAWRARRAEERHRPTGRLIEVDGVDLHYLDRGKGEALVLLHGNGSMVEDFVSSGLIDRAAERHRVIAFDRPGFGHSTRPRGKVWTPAAQAELLAEALGRLQVKRAIVLGHSWGALVALALGAKRPDLVSALVLASGYYFPSARSDALMFAPPGIPVIGDLIRYTIGPVVARLMLPGIIRKIFAPQPVAPSFAGFPREMCLRPSQLRASAVEAALMVPSAAAAYRSYGTLAMPAVIIGGDADKIVNFERQSARLHEELPGSILHRVPGVGHMIHHIATAEVLAAIEQAAALSRGAIGSTSPDRTGTRPADRVS